MKKNPKRSLRKQTGGSKLRDAAFKKENLRLQKKIFEQEARIATLENELSLRPAYSPERDQDKVIKRLARQAEKWVGKNRSNPSADQGRWS